MNKLSKKTVSLTMPQELYDRLKAYADEDRRTLSSELCQILKGYVAYMDRGGASWCRHWQERGVERYQ